MMARTTRAQMVIYAAPRFYKDCVEVVEIGKAKGERITISSFGEELMRHSFEEVKKKYVGESKPTHRARRKKLLPV